MAWVALVPLLLALTEVSPFNGFRLGLLTGLVHQTTLIYWMVYTMNTYGNLPWAVSVPVMFMLACYLALYPALFGWMVSKTLKNVRWSIFLLPFFWVALEFFRTYVFSGFPWELLGYSQFENGRLIQLADFSGVYGVSFIIVFVNAAVFAVCLYFREKDDKAPHPSKIFVISFSILASVLLILTGSYGQFRIKQMDEVIAACPVSKITVIQGNIDQGLKWDPSFQKRTIDKYIELSNTAKMDTPDLIVWPETAAPFYFLYDQPLTKILKKGLQQAQTDFLIGAPRLFP